MYKNTCRTKLPTKSKNFVISSGEKGNFLVLRVAKDTVHTNKLRLNRRFYLFCRDFCTREPENLKKASD